MNLARLRQGCVLNHMDVCKLSSIDHGKCVVVVISHDCDLASTSDDNIEIIIGTLVDKLNSQYESSRHARCLHLDYCGSDGKNLYVELRQSNKRQISKNEIQKLENIEEIFVLSPEKKQILQQWLAARYARPAFPDEFEKRLRKKIGKENVINKIEKLMGSISSHVLALYFDLGKEMSVELKEAVPYCLSITVVYDTVEGGPDARKNAEELANSLKSLFADMYGSPHSAIEIALERCTVVGDNEITLSDVRKVYQWRLEHLSLQDNQPLVNSGQLP